MTLLFNCGLFILLCVTFLVFDFVVGFHLERKRWCNVDENVGSDHMFYFILLFDVGLS